MQEMSRLKKLCLLFSTTFSISATTNGGYAIIATMKAKFVEKYHWFDEEEMLNLMSLGQSSPGPIAVNTSVLVGYRVCGLTGALVSMFGVILPPLAIMSLVSIFYRLIADNQYVKMLLKGMQAAVAALLVSIFIDLFINFKNKKSIFSFVLAVFAFIFVRYTKYSIFYLALICGILGFIKTRLLLKETNNDRS